MGFSCLLQGSDTLTIQCGAMVMEAGHTVAGVITGDETHPVGASVGDLVVRSSSATARNHLAPTSTAVFGHTRHATLQRDRAVVGHVLKCLERF